MRRRLVAAAWIAGTTVPLLLAALFLLGCCILPFHGLVHRFMPACEIAAHLMAGHADDHHGAQPLPPAREKQEPTKRIVSDLAAGGRPPMLGQAQAFVPSPSAAPRSFMTLGALRCDQDVGLHVLNGTFLI